MTDPHPKVAEVVRTQLFALSGAEHFRMGVKMFDAARPGVLATMAFNLSEIKRHHRFFNRIFGMPLPTPHWNRPTTAEVTPPKEASPKPRQ